MSPYCIQRVFHVFTNKLKGVSVFAIPPLSGNKTLKKIIEHPRFGRVVVLQTRRACRISVSVRPPSVVRLTVPVGMPLSSGIGFLAEKEEWITAALEKVAKKYPMKHIGPSYSTYMHSVRFMQSAQIENVYSGIGGDEILIAFPEGIHYTSPEVQAVAKEAALRTMRAEAKEILPEMVAQLALLHGFHFGKVTMRATRTRWGSCSSHNDISLSIFLMRLPRHLIEYIIIHELCHTRYRDHSPQFHALLDSKLGGREKELRRELLNYVPDVV